MFNPACPLCADTGGSLVFQAEKFRVIRADEVGFPAFYRVIWTAHVAEFSDLGAPERDLCMAVVHEVEQALRTQLRPTKINLAALGNVVPHLHWHVIARFDWDSHFPAPVWATALRPVDLARQAELTAQLTRVEKVMTLRLTGLEGYFQATAPV